MVITCNDGTMYPALINSRTPAGHSSSPVKRDVWYHDGNGDDFRDAQNTYDFPGAPMRYHCLLAGEYGGSLLTLLSGMLSLTTTTGLDERYLMGCSMEPVMACVEERRTQHAALTFTTPSWAGTQSS